MDARRKGLRSLGYCPYQTKLLEDTVNHSTIDWILSTEIKQDSLGHEPYTAEACARNNIDKRNYRQAHVCEGASCEKVFANLGVVTTILHEDRIPIMNVEEVDGRMKIMVTAALKNFPSNYIAFSHVWADGIRGATETGLNECQVRRLSTLSSAYRGTTGSVPFWVDCLCIPRLDKDVYFKALVGIRDVYMNACCTLVTDKAIEACTMSSSTEQLYARIYLSAWMQRMWTYEEAVLGRKLAFVLQDGFHTYSLDTLPATRQTVSVVWQCLATQLYRLRVDQKRINIGHIFQAFRCRLTNVPQEEFLSVSGMLGLDTGRLMTAKGEERTMLFWLMLRWIPFNVLFLDCPKLGMPGFQWAPKTMMYPSQTQMDTEIEGLKAKCTENGLICTYLTVSFSPAVDGSAAESGSIFYIWVETDDGSVGSHGDHRALLRLYCVESWPQPPVVLQFDTIVFPSEVWALPVRGQWVAGAACLHHGINDRSVDDTKAASSIGESRFVGRLLIERLQYGGLSSSSKTIMFEGSAKVAIDAKGSWSVKEMRIT